MEKLANQYASQQIFRRGFHYYLWLYSSIGNGALASHI
jgi:hypothetical protein